MEWNEEQLKRYSRHILLQNVGIEGQEKIRRARVLIIGTGGLGSPAALYLAAAGVGTIGLVDGDRVDHSNLQRQVIHFTPDLDKLKVDSAREKINRLNPEVKVVTLGEQAGKKNIINLIRDYDFVIDGTDNFPAKFLINDACVAEKKAFSHGGVLKFEGQSLTYLPGHSCYRCVFREAPPPDQVPSCAQAGILGAVAGILGTIQAAEALKFILKEGELLTDRLLTFDALTMRFRNISLKADKNCPACGKNRNINKQQE